ncbi:MAG: hypothetical protein QXY96_06970 [Candidatus Methanomethylicaceae archaeon]
MEGKENIGLFKYFTFGLRKEWVNDFFEKGINFFENNSLGPKQFLAFKYYLKDMELLERNKLNKIYFNLLHSILLKDSYLFWCIIWCNLTFNSNLFKWWTNFPKGSYFKKEIEYLLGKFYGKLNRCIKDACNSLVGTFERTPIGSELKQGIVEKKGREKLITKVENSNIPSLIVIYNLYKFAERNNLYEFSIYEIEKNPLSPQKIFCSSSNYIERLIIPYTYEGILYAEFENNFLKLILRRELREIDILSKYLGGEIK